MIGFIVGSIVTAVIYYYALKLYRYVKQVLKPKKQPPKIYYIDGKELVERKPRATVRRGRASTRKV